MGAIASSGHPCALELFRDVLTASSSVPGMFEPTRITVTANGREFEELHVDGGVMTNVFILPDAMLARRANAPESGKLPGSVYVIMNTRLAPEFEVVEAQVVPTLGRSLSTLLKSHSKNTVLASVEFARSTGLDFNLTYINQDLPKNFKPSFDTDYMRAVYALGYNRAVARKFWEKTISLPGR
jgi:predicted acylesterase/phospholipase RssA